VSRAFYRLGVFDPLDDSKSVRMTGPLILGDASGQARMRELLRAFADRVAHDPEVSACAAFFAVDRVARIDCAAASIASRTGASSNRA